MNFSEKTTNYFKNNGYKGVGFHDSPIKYQKNVNNNQITFYVHKHTIICEFWMIFDFLIINDIHEEKIPKINELFEFLPYSNLEKIENDILYDLEFVKNDGYRLKEYVKNMNRYGIKLFEHNSIENYVLRIFEIKSDSNYITLFGRTNLIAILLIIDIFS